MIPNKLQSAHDPSILQKILKVPQSIQPPRVQRDENLVKSYAPDPRVKETPKNLNQHVPPTAPYPISHKKNYDFNNFLQQKVTVPPKIIPRAPFPRIDLGGLSATQLHPEWVAHHIFDEQGKKQR